MLVKSKFLFVLTIFLFINCNVCISDKDEIYYGYYESNSVWGDLILLKKNGTYKHFYKPLKYVSSGTWELNDCSIYLNNFNKVIDKVTKKRLDTTLKGTATFLSFKNKLVTSEEAYGYKKME